MLTCWSPQKGARFPPAFPEKLSVSDGEVLRTTADPFGSPQASPSLLKSFLHSMNDISPDAEQIIGKLFNCRPFA